MMMRAGGLSAGTTGAAAACADDCWQLMAESDTPAVKSRLKVLAFMLPPAHWPFVGAGPATDASDAYIGRRASLMRGVSPAQPTPAHSRAGTVARETPGRRSSSRFRRNAVALC